MKVIAFYLPQFHVIPENNEWWGDGFTEWVNMKKAKPLFEGHYQPRIPLDDNYYDLSNVDVIRWQASLAREYGIHGFCFYHYWFNGKLLLQKPAEELLRNPDINIHFCFSWANESWTKAWASNKDHILIEQYYGDEHEWKNHFDYLLPFFKDDRYIKENNKPLFIIYRPELIEKINEMTNFFEKLAIENGFDGMIFAYQQVDYFEKKDKNDSCFTYNIEYQPSYAFRFMSKNGFAQKTRAIVSSFLTKIEKTFKIELRSKIKQNVSIYNYDEVWKYILNHCSGDKAIPCAFVDWDNTPRRGQRGSAFESVTVSKFKYYFSALVERAMNVYCKDYLFVFAWNEWAEGGYLEPDSKNQYGYLKAIRDTLEEKGLLQ